jgi:hypothetical protein
MQWKLSFLIEKATKTNRIEKESILPTRKKMMSVMLGERAFKQMNDILP